MPVGNTRHVRELLAMVRISGGIGNPGRAHPMSMLARADDARGLH
jgi:hypothetical protein